MIVEEQLTVRPRDEFISSIKNGIKNYGIPRWIITGFLFILFALTPFIGLDLGNSLQDTLLRFCMNAIMVLAMVPMVQSGCGLNFGLPLGIVAGLLGTTMSLQFGFSGMNSFLMAILLATPFGLLFGYGYGNLLNRIKGNEMIIATYVGFSSVAFMSIMWLLLPFTKADMVWGYEGTGLRTTISLEKYFLNKLNHLIPVSLGDYLFPLATLIVIGLLCYGVFLLNRSPLGMKMTAVGENPEYAHVTGINVNKVRLFSVILSTWLGAIGIIFYQQSFGFVQLYMGPFFMALPAVASILIGGASVRRATIPNVIIGTFLFQGILTMTPSVFNSPVIQKFIANDMAEVLRIIISNGMIIYALTRVVKRAR